MNDPLHRLNDIEIALRLLGGDATPAEIERFNKRLASDPVALRCVLDVVEQEEALEWRSASQSHLDPVDTVAGQTVPKPHSGETPPPGVGRREQRRRSQRWSFSFSLAAMLVVSASFAGGLLTYAWLPPWRSGGAVTRLSDGVFNARPAPPAGRAARNIGRLVSSSACRWGPDQRMASSGELRYGESLNLLEGVAQMRLDTLSGLADIQAEGPAGLVLTADGGCNISHGRLTATVQPELSPFILDTPLCQVMLRREGSVGVVVSGRDVQVHVFSGGAAVLVPWGLGNSNSQHFELSTGESLSMLQESEGKIRTRLGASQPTDFVSRSSMGADRLAIPDAYPEDVLSLKPSLYWRFEDGASGGIEDTSPAGGNPAIVRGTVKYIANAGNRALDLGSGVSPGVLNAHLLSSHPIDLSGVQGYSLELWVKPSHYHLGTIASLILPRTDESGVPGHGMMLELGGPRTARPMIEQPGKIRFLHRTPPSDNVELGVSCYSPAHYVLRKWQHVVATKDASTLRLYRNGELVASSEDDRMHSTAMRLLVGQIDETRRDRQFVGQIDELVFYPYALPAEAIRRHFELVKRPGPDQGEPKSPGRPLHPTDQHSSCPPTPISRATSELHS